MPKVTEKPAVYDARQTDKEDKESPWVLVNVDDETDVRHVPHEVYKARFQRSRAGGSSSSSSDDDTPNPGDNAGAGATP